MTWQQVSLAGQADFHALETRHDRVYGYDSAAQRFMVTTDRREWDFGAVMTMLDFAISPGDPRIVVAASEQGLVRSSDGGESFTVLDVGPQITLLAWPRDAALFGVAADGQVQLSTDGGRAWERRGRVDGRPQAIVADESRVFVATDTGVYVSDDGARTFTLHYRER